MARTAIDYHQGFRDVDATGAGEDFETYLTGAHDAPVWQASRSVRYELASLVEGERVLDAGCGIGMDLAGLSARLGAAGEIVGFDLSADLIGRARKRAAALATPVAFQQGDLHSLPFADASFDAVWSERVLMYLDRPLDAVREVLRVLKPGGRFLAGEIDFASVWAVSTDEALRQALQEGTMQSVRNPSLARQLPGLCHQAGFATVRVEPTLGVGRDFAITERAGNLGWHLDRRVEKGLISRAAADAWLETQRRISAEGSYVSTLVVPNVMAVKASRG